MSKTVKLPLKCGGYKVWSRVFTEMAINGNDVANSTGTFRTHTLPDSIEFSSYDTWIGSYDRATGKVTVTDTYYSNTTQQHKGMVHSVVRALTDC